MNANEKLEQTAKSLSVLYAEDEDDTRTKIAEILEIFFKDVYATQDGEEALKIYKENSVDLLMTDLTMPKLDGLGLISEIKKINPEQAVIVLTAHNSSENLMETIDLQIDGFLIKPMKMNKMLDLLYKITHIINLEKKQL